MSAALNLTDHGAPFPPVSILWQGRGPSPPHHDHVVASQSGVDSITALDAEVVGVARIDWVSFPNPSPSDFYEAILAMLSHL